MPRFVRPVILSAATLSLTLCASGAYAVSDLTCRDDAMLVLDASGSMVQKAGDKTRITMARESIRRVIPSAAHQRRLGLMTFGPGSSDQCSNITTRVPLQSNAAASIIDQVEGIVPDGGTPIATAIERAANALDYQHRKAVVVVVTDGDETCRMNPCDVAQKLHASAKDLTVHIIGIDSSPAQQISCFAEATGGLYVPAKTEEELSAALRETLDCPQLALSLH
jgi:Ca-activated chloride channel family protein